MKEVTIENVKARISKLQSRGNAEYSLGLTLNEEFELACLRRMLELEANLAALAAESAGLNAFVNALLSIAWQGGSADGAEIQDLALKHGLLRQEVYSADDHETLVDDPGNFEDGDPVYFRVETPATDDFLAEVRAQGVEMFAIEWGGHDSPYGQDAYNFADKIRKGVQS